MKIDALLRQGLSARATGDSGDLLTVILEAAAAKPQRRPFLWTPRATNRRLLMLGLVALLLAAMAGAAAMGSWILRPTPAPIPQIQAHVNGEILAHGEGCELVALDPVTGSHHRLFAGVPDCYPTMSYYSLAWSPEGERLAFGYGFFCGGCGSEEATRAIAGKIEGIWVLDPASGQATHLVTLSPVLFDPVGVSWSLDGTRIAYVSDHAVWAVSAAGGSPTRASPAASLTDMFVWSPDSEHVAFVSGPGTRFDVETARFDGSDHRTIFEVSNETIEGIAWSPDGRSIIVSTSGNPGALRILATDGSSSTTLLQFSADVRPLSPRWSPNGDQIAFARVTGLLGPDTAQGTSQLDLMVMAAAEGDARVLYHAPWPVESLSDLAWSPDGMELSFSLLRAAPSDTEPRPAGSGVYVAEVAGDGTAAMLLPLPEIDAIVKPARGPAWQPLPAS